MIDKSDFFGILWVYVTFGVDYEYIKKNCENLIFDHFYYFLDFFFSQKNKQKVGEKISVVTFEKEIIKYEKIKNIKKKFYVIEITIF